MKKITFLLGLAVVLLSIGCTVKGPPSHDLEPGTVPYEAGQRWKYHTRDGEEDSRILILKVEEFGESPDNIIVVHIQVTGIAIKGPDGKALDIIQHMPFDVSAMDRSVTELIESNVPLPDFQKNYDYWRREFDKQKAGVYDETVEGVVQILEDALNQ